MTITSRIDHLVVAADTLAQGVAWCEATFGVTPGPGGEHGFMGTHNRLLRIATPAYPRAYLEIIAVNPDAPPPGRPRWFDLDDEALRAAIRIQPRLVHFVASTPNGSAAIRALAALGIDRGSMLQAARKTADGWLRWHISVRADGQRLYQGTLPTLIEWGDAHPCDAMPESGLSLEGFSVSHPDVRLAAAYTVLRLERVQVTSGPPNISAQVRGPRGVVTLQSGGA